MNTTITLKEVAEHCKEGDAWVIIHNDVYDISKFGKMHPGGLPVLRPYYGLDATEAFDELHRQDVLLKYKRLIIGKLSGSSGNTDVGDASESGIPYGEPSAWQKFKSPYYNESHGRFRKAVREFYDREIARDAPNMDRMGTEPPLDMWKKMGEFGILACRIGPGEHLRGRKLPGGVTPDEFDYFHTLIAHQEHGRIGCPAVSDGLGAGFCIGFPPLIHFGTDEMKYNIAPTILDGRKRICLAISEPFAGSDVANIKTTAVKSADGSHFIVNGVKKWVWLRYICKTKGLDHQWDVFRLLCVYGITAVRTGGSGIGGISLLLIERGPGLTTSKMKTSYGGAAGTAYIVYDNCKVPIKNLIGKENQGFKCIMFNFNHERWFIVASVHRLTRLVVEECFKWANQRSVFGKKLIQQPVIRNMLAQMVVEVETVENWLENVTYQMNQMSYVEQSKHLGGPIALLKLASTRAQLAVSDKACQVFGGRAITQTGMGQIIERFQRSVKYAAILGGSEEIMGDLGIRQAMKYTDLSSKL